MTKGLEDDLPKIGYLYHYPKLDHPTNKFRLDIFISSIPTEEHFDVLRAHFFVKGPKGMLDRLTITHPWDFEKTSHVCEGLIIMEDRKGKKEEAFSFGGQLKIDVKENQTVCTLVSSAPILEISDVSPLHVLFIEELEVLFAEHRAKNVDRQEYETHLCEADPLELYIACLGELIKKFDHFPHKDEKYLQLLMFLHSNEHRLALAGLLDESTTKLENILNE